MRVDRAGGLVEHEDRRVDQQRAREGEPLPLTAGQRSSALGDARLHRVRDVGGGVDERIEHVVRRRRCDRRRGCHAPGARHVEQLAQGARQEHRVLVLHEDRGPQALARDVAEPLPVERDVGTTVAEAGESQRQLVGGDLLRADDRGEHARLDHQPGHRIGELARRGVERRQPRVRHGVTALERQHLHHASGRDVGPRPLLRGLGERAQGQQQEGREAVEHHELADVEAALDDQPRAEPRDDDDEQPRQGHLLGIEERVHPSRLDGRLPHLLRRLVETAEEQLFAADAAQHAQARDGVGGELGRAAELLALLGLGALEGLDEGADGEPQQRDPDEDDGAEQR